MSLLSGKNQSRILLLIAALSGWIIAVGRRPVWQDPVESAQVLAGLVSYPTDNPFYIFHVKVWSIINQVVALMLHSTVSEITASLFLGGMVGAISFAGIFLIVDSVCSKPFVALLTPLFMYSLSLVGASGAYPIALLGSPASYGILGLSFMLLVIGLLGTGRYKTGAFFAGLAPAVHPGLGTFCVLVASFSVFVNRRELRLYLPQLLGFLVLGAITTCVSLGWQIYQCPRLPLLDPHLKKAYLEAFIRNLDYHRIAGDWVQPCVLFAIMLAIICTFSTRQQNVPCGAKLVFSSVVVSVVTALTLVLVTDLVPPLAFLKILIPWRFINYANICLIPISFGILLNDYPNTPKLRVLIFTAILSFCILLRLLKLQGDNILYFLILVCLVGIVMLNLRDPLQKFFDRRAYWQSIFIIFVIVFAFSWQIVSGAVELAAKKVKSIVPGAVTLLAVKKVKLYDRTNTEIFRVASTRPGILLTAGGMHQIQLVTRRPVLIDGGGLDMFPYITETGPRFNGILKGIYGVDMFVPPPANAHYKGGLSYAHQSLWERRSREEWLSISKEFGVTDILTPIAWNLQLPIVAKEFDADGKLTPFYWDPNSPAPGKGSGLTLYTIPQESKQQHRGQ